MDENNPILKLIHRGMRMEGEGKIDRAQELFMQAWNEASNDQEKCVAAHFVARNQKSPKDTLKWNAESLERANNVENDEVKGYYPSLYLNIGTSHEDLGNHAEAKKYYDLAFEALSDLPTGKAHKEYNRGVRENILKKRRGLVKCMDTELLAI